MPCPSLPSWLWLSRGGWMGRGLPRRVAVGPSSGRRASILRTYGREPVDSPILHRLQKVSEREESEQRELFRSLWLFSPLVKTRPMGRPWDNVRYWRRGGGRLGVTCARKSQHRAQRCAARLNKLCMRLKKRSVDLGYHTRCHTRYALGSHTHQHKETPPHSNGAKARARQVR